MATTISFTYKDKDYCLEFTRDSVRTMQKSGFALDDISSKGLVVLPDLFSGAFLAHHPTVKKAVIEEIYKKLPHKKELFLQLAQMFNEPIEAYLDEPEEGDALNWKAM